MDMKTLLKLSLMGLLAFAGTMTAVSAAEADDAETEEAAPKKKAKKAKKGKKKAPEATRMFVAIQKFENKSGAEDGVFETIRARVQQYVVGTRKFEVVEREQLKTVMSEQNLAASGVTSSDDADAPEAGKLKAASYVVYGTVLFCGMDKASGSAEGISSAVTKSKVELQIKITNGESGKILAQKSLIGYGVDKAVATTEFSASKGQGLRDAIDEACHMVVDKIRDVAYPAKIVRVGKKDVTINMTEDEVQEDDVFLVEEADEPVVDPDTGSFLGYDGDEVGRIRISRTGPKMSKAIPLDGLDLDDLDTDEHTYIVRRVSKATLKKEAKKASQRRKAVFEDRF